MSFFISLPKKYEEMIENRVNSIQNLYKDAKQKKDYDLILKKFNIKVLKNHYYIIYTLIEWIIFMINLKEMISYFIEILIFVMQIFINKNKKILK
mgnify:CR=1 FL=1